MFVDCYREELPDVLKIGKKGKILDVYWIKDLSLDLLTEETNLDDFALNHFLFWLHNPSILISLVHNIFLPNQIEPYVLINWGRQNIFLSTLEYALTHFW